LFSPLPGLDQNEVARKLSLYRYDLLLGRRHWRSDMHRQTENAKKGVSAFSANFAVVAFLALSIIFIYR
jgi:hypothetical protein